MKAMIGKAKRWARAIRTDVVALHIAGRDPRTPWRARALCIAVVAYALCPIDLIPDVIPVLGLLDDLLIVPLGLLLAVRMIPPPLMEEYRRMAATRGTPPAHWLAASFVVAVWALAAVAAGWWAYARYR